MRDHEPVNGTVPTRESDSPEDAALIALLREVGKREVPPSDFAREMRASLHAEWQQGIARKQQGRRRMTFIGAAAATVAAMAIGVGLWMPEPAVQSVAMLDRIEGVVSVAAAGADAVDATPNLPLHAGDRLLTGGSARAALEFASGVSVRLDRDSEVTFAEGGDLVLTRGAVYVDAGTQPQGGNNLLVSTPFGSVRHLGTQYEVRVLADSLSVSVREGRIELRTDDAALQGAAGERLLVTASGNVDRQSLAPDAAEWTWIGDITPAFAIDNRPLIEFLAWAGRESGRDVVFGSPASQAEASAVVLRGAVDGLTPDQAIDAVLATTTLRAERSPGRITILPQN